jgi:hypothetical protein
MKRKIFLVVLSAVILVSLSATESHSYWSSAQTWSSGRSLQEMWGNWSPSQTWSGGRSWQEVWGNWMPNYENQVSLAWIQDQIELVLDQLREAGIQLPADAEQKLDEFFSNVLDNLNKGRMRIPFFNSDLFHQSPYNLSWNYDAVNGVADFSADNIFADESGCTLIELGGESSATGLWDLNFSVQGATSNQAKSSSTYAMSSLKTRRYQARIPSRLAQYANDYILMGSICQDGLVSLYLNPCRTVHYTFGGKTYATKSGFEISQEGGFQNGVLYFDLIENYKSDNEVQLYNWETPLW